VYVAWTAFVACSAAGLTFSKSCRGWGIQSKKVEMSSAALRELTSLNYILVGVDGCTRPTCRPCASQTLNNEADQPAEAVRIRLFVSAMERAAQTVPPG